jgi:hypothetical protein
MFGAVVFIPSEFFELPVKAALHSALIPGHLKCPKIRKEMLRRSHNVTVTGLLFPQLLSLVLMDFFYYQYHDHRTHGL